MSVYLVEPMKSHVTVDDWFRNHRQRQTEYNELTNLGFNVRQKSGEIRDVSNIETQLNRKLTEELLTDRYKEIWEWKIIIEDCIRDIKNELQRLKYEKELCTRELQNLNPKFTVVNECHTLRCERVKADMCRDLVEIELEKEHNLLETIKKDISDRCEQAFTRSKEAEEFLNQLEIDVDQKNETCKIEKSTLDLTDEAANISRKPNMDRFINYSSYKSWLENCKYLQSQTLIELKKCITLREDMGLLRQNASSQISGQFDATNFALRKRIFETRLLLEDSVWQKQMLHKEKERLSFEIDKLRENVIHAKEALKIFESQNRNRIYRVNIELCEDKCTENLEVQVLNAKQRVNTLESQLNSTIKTHNLMDQQIERLEEELRGKTCAMTIDIRCLEIKNEESDFKKM